MNNIKGNMKTEYGDLYEKEIQRYVHEYVKFIAELLANGYWVSADVTISLDGKDIEEREIWVKKSSGISGKRLDELLKLAKKHNHELYVITVAYDNGREIVLKFREKRG